VNSTQAFGEKFQGVHWNHPEAECTVCFKSRVIRWDVEDGDEHRSVHLESVYVVESVHVAADFDPSDPRENVH